MRAAVVGHMEWVEFAVLDSVPTQGEVVHASETFEDAAGGGAVAAVQLVRLTGGCDFFTAFGDDDLAERAARRLTELGVTVHYARRRRPTRRAFTYLDAQHERTITTLGDRIGPKADDDLPWEKLDSVDAVYLTSGDAGAVREARRARALVATARALAALKESHVRLDALVASANDANERYAHGELDPAPDLVVQTAGAAGGNWTGLEGRTGEFRAAEVPGEPVDAYGCGDSFAAGLAYGLADDRSVAGALELAARCGAVCLTGRGPYGAQLSDPDRDRR
ncbi:MAG: PfkB family carbohydrate kinase [Thermoleophilaceae bacterium]